MQRLTSTKLFKVVLLAALFGVLIFANPTGLLNPVRNVFLNVFSPFKKITYTVSATIEGVGSFIGSIGQLKDENRDLMIENEKLLGERAMLMDMKNENDDLRSQLGLLPRNNFELLTASIISQDMNGMGNWIEIDKGVDDGLHEGMPVIVSKGILIGRIGEVTSKTSKIVLLTNPKSIISVVTIQNGAKGVARGEYGLGVIFDMILQTDSIKVGDEVVTSGTSVEMPRGFYIGTIQNVHSSDDHLFQQAAIVSPIKISKLQYVFVVLGNKKS